jgi:hypothetical protein
MQTQGASVRAFYISKIGILVWSMVLVGLYISSQYSYLLFHTLVEIFSVTVGWLMLGIVWAASMRQVSGFYLTLGIAYFFIGFIDLIHTLAYKGMNIFVGYDSNLPTQLWISARYMEAMTLFAAQFYYSEKLNKYKLFATYFIVTLIFLIFIFAREFPDCYIEGKGLTPFKIVSEYIICIILIIAGIYLNKRRDFLSSYTYKLMLAAIICTIIAELFFTFYVSVYGISNMLGHYFKLLSFYFVYKAIVETSIKEPYKTIYAELEQSKNELEQERAQLLEALKRIKTLEDFLPICASCKRIRLKDGSWEQIESYITQRTGSMFSHGICPECARKLYSELLTK